MTQIPHVSKSMLIPKSIITRAMATARYNVQAHAHGSTSIPCPQNPLHPSLIPLLERLHAVISRAVFCMMRILAGFVHGSLTCHNFVIPNVPQRSVICHMYYSGHQYSAYSVTVREFKKETDCMFAQDHFWTPQTSSADNSAPELARLAVV